MRRARSLTLRIMLLAALWSVLSLAVAGVVLVELYQAASERAFDERLDVYMTTVIGALSEDAGDEDTSRQGASGQGDGETSAAALAPLLVDERFRQPLSGWYWSVRRADSDDVVYASPSLVGDMLSLPNVTAEDGSWRGYATGPAGEEIRVLQRVIEFSSTRRLRIAIAGETSLLSDEIAEFAGQVALTLAVFALGLIGAGIVQIHFGMKPLTRLRASFAAVRRGEAQTIDEDLPSELAPLAMELNALIAANGEIVERARSHVGNLAHALKTPLSVITNEARAGKGPLADKIVEQAAAMRTQIDHHLERARMAAQRRVIGISSDVGVVVERMVRVMNKIHGERALTYDSEVADGLHFRGERQDLEELLGNLLDNASKWAISRVRLRAYAELNADTRRPIIAIDIDDDGPGLPHGERAAAVERGRRLDETVPGSGLGLSIVADLTILYGGRFALEASDLGGLRARLELPSE